MTVVGTEVVAEVTVFPLGSQPLSCFTRNSGSPVHGSYPVTVQSKVSLVAQLEVSFLSPIPLQLSCNLDFN